MAEWEDRDAARGSPPQPGQPAVWSVLGAAFAGVLVLLSVRCALGPQSAPAYPSRTLPPEPPPVLAAWDGPSEDYFPCSDCHEDEPTDRTVRELELEHEDLELAHGDLWCLHCHEADDRDRLHLADGKPVAFEDSWRLCTQCHGQKLADWRAGVHGKRVGHWWGRKEYRTCVSCHRPHRPRFESLEPLPPPVPPDRIAQRRNPPASEEPHE